jgi:hypothetical protein
MSDDDRVRWWRVSTRGNVTISEVFEKPDSKPKDTGASWHFRNFVRAVSFANDQLERRVLSARRELERQQALAKTTRDRWRRDFAEVLSANKVQI